MEFVLLKEPQKKTLPFLKCEDTTRRPHHKQMDLPQADALGPWLVIPTFQTCEKLIFFFFFAFSRSPHCGILLQ